MSKKQNHTVRAQAPPNNSQRANTTPNGPNGAGAGGLGGPGDSPEDDNNSPGDAPVAEPGVILHDHNRNKKDFRWDCVS